LREKWQPSKEVQSIIVAELLGIKEPIRFRDLWKRCQDRLSKASFVRGIETLTEQGIVIRAVLGHKHVEFQLNAKHPEVKERIWQASCLVEEAHNLYGRYEKLMVTLGNSLSQVPKNRRRMRTAIKALVYAHAWLLASANTEFTFSDADITVEHGERPIIQRVFTEAITRLSLIQKKGIEDLFKVDRQLTRQALEDWLTELEARTSDVLRKAS
jgi:hypothetical protein